MTIHVPPLRRRVEDIPLLAEHFTARYCQRHGLPLKELTSGCLDMLAAYSWPGNVRELRNVMERVALLAAGREATPADLPPALSGSGEPSGEKRIPTLREVEAEHIRRVLALGVSMEQAAELLGINTVTLWRKRKELGDA